MQDFGLSSETATASKAGVIPDAGVVALTKPKAYLDAASTGRIWNREPSVRTVF